MRIHPVTQSKSCYYGNTVNVEVFFVVHIEDYCRHAVYTDHHKEKATETIPNFPSCHGVTSFGFGPVTTNVRTSHDFPTMFRTQKWM